MPTVEELVARGDIGGRTVQIVSSGAVECATYEPAPLADGSVRIRTVRSAISPGTEMTFFGRDASNVYLHKRWNDELRLFEPAEEPSMTYPIAFGYRAAGEVVDSGSTEIPIGTRVYGSWRHTELTAMPAARAASQRLPDELTWDDGVDLGQMGPIAVNAVAFADDEHRGRSAVVFGAGPVGLITAQIAAADGASVHVVDRLPSRLAIARDLGLATIEAGEGVDVAAMLKRRLGPEAVSVAWECTGSTFALHEAIRAVRRQGLVVAVGFYQGEARGLILGDEFHHNGVRIVCGQIGNVHRSTSSEALRARTIDLARSGAVKLGSLPRLTLPVERVAEAFEALRRPDEVLQTALDYATRPGGADAA
jgi:D-arabinose 1-dehydrogenase-like Zn-dependent alcohol dehydrogenase